MGLLLCGSVDCAQGQCAQWDASGKWTIKPEAKSEVSLDVKQDGTLISGTASGADDSKGSVSGTMKGDDLSIKITWEGKDPVPKVFIAKVAADGKLDGTTLVFDLLPKTIKWSTEHLLKCASSS